VAASLPIGVLPSTWLLQQYSLDEIFSPLIRSIKVGDFEQFTSILYGPWREWFRDLGLWILFTERLETLVWRSFIRRWYHLHNFAHVSFLTYYLPLRAQNPQAHASIPLELIAQTVNPILSRATAIRGEYFIPYDADDIVGMCINLIDQVISICVLVDAGISQRTYCDGEENIGRAKDRAIWIHQGYRSKR